MSDSKLRVWFSLFVLAVFCVGLAGGALVARRLLPLERPVDRFFRGPGPGPMMDPEGRRGAPMRGLLVERLTRDLDLTPEQRTKIDAALAAGRTRLDALQRDVRDRFEGERKTVRDEIRAALTPAQQQRFDRIEIDGRGRMGRRGPPR